MENVFYNVELYDVIGDIKVYENVGIDLVNSFIKAFQEPDVIAVEVILVVFPENKVEDDKVNEEKVIAVVYLI